MSRGRCDSHGAGLASRGRTTYGQPSISGARREGPGKWWRGAWWSACQSWRPRCAFGQRGRSPIECAAGNANRDNRPTQRRDLRRRRGVRAVPLRQVHELQAQPHSQRRSRTPAARFGCESCHGPASAHVKGGGGRGVGGLMTFAAAPVAERNAVCASATRADTGAVGGSTHEQRNLGCTDCHSPHAGHPKLLQQASQQQTCTKCHQQIRQAIDEGLPPSDPRREDAVHELPQPARHASAASHRRQLRQRQVLRVPRREAGARSCSSTRPCARAA